MSEEEMEQNVLRMSVESNLDVPRQERQRARKLQYTLVFKQGNYLVDNRYKMSLNEWM
jgi:hypothetical protein